MGKRLDFNEVCATKNQIADIFTKALSRGQFKKNKLKLSLIEIS